MMIRRPEGLFPVESAKAELHGIGVAAEVTAGSSDELALAEETAVIIESDEEVVVEPTPETGPSGPPGDDPDRREGGT